MYFVLSVIIFLRFECRGKRYQPVAGKQQKNLEEAAMRGIKKAMAMILATVLTMGTAMPLAARQTPTEARNIAIHSTEGEHITLARALGGRTTDPRPGQRLSDGNVLSTGRDSFVYLQLDAASLIKMDESSRVTVNESANLLSLAIQTGRALVEVNQQPPGQMLETRLGNTAFAVRGTSFIAGHVEGDVSRAVFVTVLSGYGVLVMPGLGGVPVELDVTAGSRVVARPWADVPYVVEPSLDVGQMGLFELREVYARAEELIAAGVLTREMHERIPAEITGRQAERNERIGIEDAQIAQIAEQGFGQVEVAELPPVEAMILPETLPVTGIVRATDGHSRIAAGLSHSLAIREDGSLWAWGGNDAGQLGDGTTTDRHSPVHIMDDVVSVTAGHNYTLAIRQDGSLWAWGRNNQGQLGNGTTIDNHYPVHVMYGVASVTAGHYHTSALRQDGSLWAWGQNWAGQLGDGTTTDRHSPVHIMDGVVSVTAGQRHMLAIREDGSLWAWGSNVWGQLGDGTAAQRIIPVHVMDGVASVTAGSILTLAIREDGSLWAWGFNSQGQVGDGTTTDRHSPVHIMDGVVSVTSGNGNSFAIRENGSLWAWGWNSWGRLGVGTSNDHHSPVHVMNEVVSVAASSLHSLAIREDGSLRAWGRNIHGQLGDGTTTDRQTPVQVIFP